MSAEELALPDVSSAGYNLQVSYLHVLKSSAIRNTSQYPNLDEVFQDYATECAKDLESLRSDHLTDKQLNDNASLARNKYHLPLDKMIVPLNKFLDRFPVCRKYKLSSTCIPIGYSSQTGHAFALCLAPSTLTFHGKNFDFAFDVLRVLQFPVTPDDSPFAILRFHSVHNMWRCIDVFENCVYAHHRLSQGRFFKRRLAFHNEMTIDEGSSTTSGSAAPSSASTLGSPTIFACDSNGTRSKEQAYSCFTNPSNSNEIILRAYYSCGIDMNTNLACAAPPQNDGLDFISSVPPESLLRATFNTQVTTTTNKFGDDIAARYSFSDYHRQRFPGNRPAIVFETTIDAATFLENKASRRFFTVDDVVLSDELSHEDRSNFSKAKLRFPNADPKTLFENVPMTLEMICIFDFLWNISCTRREDRLVVPVRSRRVVRSVENKLVAQENSKCVSEILLREESFRLPKIATPAMPAGGYCFDSIADTFAADALSEIVGAAFKVIPVYLERGEYPVHSFWAKVRNDDSIMKLFTPENQKLIRDIQDVTDLDHGIMKALSRSVKGGENLPFSVLRRLVKFHDAALNDGAGAAEIEEAEDDEEEEEEENEEGDEGEQDTSPTVVLPYNMYEQVERANAEVLRERNRVRAQIMQQLLDQGRTELSATDQFAIYMGPLTAPPLHSITDERIAEFRALAPNQEFAQLVMGPLQSRFATTKFKEFKSLLEIHKGLRSHMSNLSHAIILTLINRSPNNNNNNSNGDDDNNINSNELKVQPFLDTHLRSSSSPFTSDEQKAFVRHIRASFIQSNEQYYASRVKDNDLNLTARALLHPSTAELPKFDLYRTGFVVGVKGQNLQVFVPVDWSLYEYPVPWKDKALAALPLGHEVQVHFEFGALESRGVADADIANAAPALQQQQQENAVVGAADNDDSQEDAHTNASSQGAAATSVGVLASIKPEWKTHPTLCNKFDVFDEVPRPTTTSIYLNNVAGNGDDEDEKTQEPLPLLQQYCRKVTFHVYANPICPRCLSAGYLPELAESMCNGYEQNNVNAFKCFDPNLHRVRKSGSIASAAEKVSTSRHHDHHNHHHHYNNHGAYHNHRGNNNYNNNGAHGRGGFHY